MGTVASAGSLFTGTSQFSSDLETALQNAITAASEPLTAMQTDLTTLQSQQSELNSLSSDFTSLQTAINNVASAVGVNSYAASASDPSVASVSLSGTPGTGSLTLDVTRMGSYSSAMSSDGLPTVSNPSSGNISGATSFTLSVGASSQTITPSGTSLSDLAAAINATGSASAMVVNIGSASSPDYRLFVQGTEFGDQPIQLTANGGSEPGQTLLTAEATGEDATYQVNGEPATPLSTTTPTVTLAPGVTATLEGTGATTINITRSTTSLDNALSNLASAYNTAISELNKNHGQSGGALTGDSVVDALGQTLGNMMGYSGSGSGITTLTDLGFSFDTNGVLSFDPTTIDSASSSQLSQIFTFLGSASGRGFLEAATNTMNSILDPTTGLLTTDISQVNNDITAENQKISEEQTQITALQTNLTNQMNAADAAISSMEQQLVFMQNLFSATLVEEQSIAAG